MGTFGGKRLTAGTGGVVLAGFLGRGGTAVNVKWYIIYKIYIRKCMDSCHTIAHEHGLGYLANCLHLDTYCIYLPQNLCDA